MLVSCNIYVFYVLASLVSMQTVYSKQIDLTCNSGYSVSENCNLKSCRYYKFLIITSFPTK